MRCCTASTPATSSEGWKLQCSWRAEPYAYRKLLVNALVGGVQYLPGVGTNVAAGDRCGHAKARL